MDFDTLIAQWSGKAPPGFVPHAVIRQEPPRVDPPSRPVSDRWRGPPAAGAFHPVSCS